MAFNQKQVLVNDLPILAESLKWCIAGYTDKYSLTKNVWWTVPFILWSVLFSPYSGTNQKPLIKAILGQL